VKAVESEIYIHNINAMAKKKAKKKVAKKKSAKKRR
jgi:hypothetical protein